MKRFNFGKKFRRWKYSCTVWGVVTVVYYVLCLHRVVHRRLCDSPHSVASLIPLVNTLFYCLFRVYGQKYYFWFSRLNRLTVGNLSVMSRSILAFFFTAVGWRVARRCHLCNNGGVLGIGLLHDRRPTVLYCRLSQLYQTCFVFFSSKTCLTRIRTHVTLLIYWALPCPGLIKFQC